MAELDDIIVGMVALSGGELVGRIRLQKIIYLLEQKGLQSRVEFIYHHYGPYSEAVADAVADAQFWSALEEVTEFRQSDGAPFGEFKTDRPAADITRLGDMSSESIRGLLEKLKSINSTVLEHAATVHWLCFVEKVTDWRCETEIRKPGKTKSGRLEKALDLLKELNLAPGAG